MDKLPNEIEALVFQFVPIKTLALCNKKYWIADYKSRLINFKPDMFEKYSRFLIKNDAYYIFKFYMDNNIQLIKKRKKIYYHNKIFWNRIEWLRYLSRLSNSSKCSRKINKIIKTERLVFKNIKTQKCRWSN
jgi:hypothetical protein